MASMLVMNAVEAQLAANWPNAPAIILPNKASLVPADGSAFLTLEYPIANEEQISVGSPGANVFRETGAFRLTLSVPIGAGRIDKNTGQDVVGWMDALRAAFRGQTFSGVKTWAPSSVATNDKSDDGAYYELSFAVPYYADNLF
jgi:hypothetical protein